uniref:Pco130633 n=1 Tax=Arundo donax TaxID=35708 RepID=A0A0A9E0Z2_ARUDO
MFSYGSGLTSSMFSLKLHDDQHTFSLANIAYVLDVTARLESRHVYGLPFLHFSTSLLL